MADENIEHSGGCHCGFVRFTCQAPAILKVTDCNCSICEKKGFRHLILPPSLFKLVSPPSLSELGLYTFNTHTAKHYFCPKCGIAPFYIPRSHPDHFDVNARCIDSDTVTSIEVKPFNGQQWEKSVEERGLP
ncbi:Mss4-like protein [Powellomyces hirtus]|nr:Mss4-like protein [Powellomyces hirtus]